MANTDPTREPKYGDSTGAGRVYDDPTAPPPGQRDPTQNYTGDSSGSSAADLRGREKAASGRQRSSAGEKAEQEKLGKGYTGGDSSSQGSGGSFAKKLRGSFKNLGKRKIAAWTGVISAIIGLFAGGFSLFNFLNIFQLDHMLSNIERKAFLRYQVDMEGRSKKWINTYLTLRMGEVEDEELRPRNRDNILFRANNISKLADPALYTWYKLLRGSSFEQDLLEKQGIKFASIAYKDGNVVKFRPAVITIKDENLTFRPSDAEIRAIETGDISMFNGKLRDFIDVEILDSDKVARKRLAEAIHANTKDYNAIKRYFLRKSIQNMTGIRDWRFYESWKIPRVLAGGKKMTPQEYAEWKREIRNKFIVKIFPESMVGGKYIQCFFGLTDCKKTTTDPSNPENRSALKPLPKNCGGEENPECKTSIVDEEGNAADLTDDIAEGLEDGVEKRNDGDLTKSVSKKLMTQLLTKLSGPIAVVSALEFANQIDKQIDDGTLSTMVYNARSQQAQALYATAGTMRDQLKTPDIAAAEEVDASMEMFAGGGNSEGWETVVAAGDASLVSAAEFEKAENREKYCGPEHQEAMVQPENWEKSKDEHALLCEHERIGGESLAKDIEDGWQNSIGVVLDPILALYRGVGLSTVMGWFDSALDAIFEKTVGPLMKGILSATGLGDKVQDLMAWLMTKMAAILGAGPAIVEYSPPGVVLNHVLMGASAAAEAAARNQGAALTNAASSGRSNQAVAAHLEEERASQGYYDRYLSLDNPKSALGQGLFAVADNGVWKTFTTTLGNIFSGAIFANRGYAATEDGYAASKFAGVETYDFPSHCINEHPLDMTAQSSTNADELGLIPANELTWDLVGNSNAFYERMYQGDDYDGEKIKKVYNCALLDSSIRGGLGAAYNDKTLDENSYGFGFSGATSGAPTGQLSAEQLRSSSENIECAQGTKDVGVHTGYTRGNPVQIRLCAIPGFPSTSSESQSGSQYYIAGANGMGLVNSNVSGNWLALITAAKAAGHTVAAASTFRTMAHQQDLCNANTQCSNGSYKYVAKPGTSNHQMGLAIDFGFSKGGGTGSCVTVGGVCTLPGDPFWVWLRDNAGSFGMGQYSAEYWHWDPKVLRN